MIPTSSSQAGRVLSYTLAVEVWNPLTQHYVRLWTGCSARRAHEMFNKPYYSRHTRRLRAVTVTETILKKAKGGR